MPSTIPVDPNCFVTEAQAEAYALSGMTPSSVQADQVVNGINWATAELERMTGRILKARTFSLQRSATVTTDPGTSRLLGGGSVLSAVHVGDPVVSAIASFPVNCRVTAGWDGSGVTVSGTLPAGSGTATFGNGGLIFDGPGSRSMYVDEWPLKALYAAYSQDVLGNLVALDLGHALIEYPIGKVTIFNDTFYLGTSNIVVECRVGYEQPTGAVIGDGGDWNTLSTITLRLASLYWQEWLVPSGRSTDVSAGQAHATHSTASMPPDLLAMVMGYARRGM